MEYELKSTNKQIIVLAKCENERDDLKAKCDDWKRSHDIVAS